MNLLKLREGDIVKGLPVSPMSLKLTFDDEVKDVVNDFKANGKRSLAVVQRRTRLEDVGDFRRDHTRLRGQVAGRHHHDPEGTDGR
jgi:hypothetical protein